VHLPDLRYQLAFYLGGGRHVARLRKGLDVPRDSLAASPNMRAIADCTLLKPSVPPPLFLSDPLAPSSARGSLFLKGHAGPSLLAFFHSCFLFRTLSVSETCDPSANVPRRFGVCQPLRLLHDLSGEAALFSPISFLLTFSFADFPSVFPATIAHRIPSQRCSPLASLFDRFLGIQRKLANSSTPLLPK